MPSRAVSLVLLAAVVLATRLPFLGAGYGLHADNWRVALAARHIAETGAYEASRLPGYPLQEYICALFWKTGPFGLNLLDALFCAAASVMFALICIDYGVADWWLAALALAFVPVLYVNSVSSKDFPWALAFLLAAWWCAMRKRPALTGILLGLAMGCRITSGAAALPIALILIDRADSRTQLRRVLTVAIIAAVIVLAAFTPVYARYGRDFLDFYAEHAFPGRREILARMTLEVWGLLGFAGICLAALGGMSYLAPWQKRPARPRLFTTQPGAWANMLVIYAVAFFCLPDEAAYLIPAVPFTLLLAWWAAPRWVFQTCCLLIVVSPFVTWDIDRERPAAGLIFQDHRDRLATDDSVAGFLHFCAGIPGRNAYIVGSWEPPIAVLTASAPPLNTKFLYLVTKPELAQLLAQGWRVWYLPYMRQFNARVYHYDVALYGAADVRLLAPSKPASRP
jgi:hypothetical protein